MTSHQNRPTVARTGAVAKAAIMVSALTLTPTVVVDAFSQQHRLLSTTYASSNSRAPPNTRLFFASEERVHIPEIVNDDDFSFPRRPRPHYQSSSDDDTSSPSSSDGGSASSKNNGEDEEFVFISVEEAEERLQHERMQFDLDHEEMRRLIEEQRHELDELHYRAERQRRGSSPSSSSSTSSTRSRRDDEDDDNEDRRSSSRSSNDDRDHHRHRSSPPPPPHAHVRPPPPPPPHMHQRQHHHRHHGPKQPFMQPDEAFSTVDSFGDPTPMMSHHEAHILDLERRLHQAMEENTMLVEQLHSQRHMYDEEKRDLERRIHEERERVVSLQEELTMERTYFEQSKVELEDLVAAERKKVEHLQGELHIREMQDQQESMFHYHQEHYQAQNGGNTRTQYSQSGVAAAAAAAAAAHRRATGVGGASNGVYMGATGPPNAGNPRRQPHEPFNGLEMNDIRSPLYP